jgi:glutaconate CoA-transferase, subunit B
MASASCDPGGRSGRRALALTHGGPHLVITPKCIFDFDEEGRIRVRSINPGTAPRGLQDSTGFDLGDLSAVPETALPSAEEPKLLRRQVDPRGMLLRFMTS